MIKNMILLSSILVLDALVLIGGQGYPTTSVHTPVSTSTTTVAPQCSSGQYYCEEKGGCIKTSEPCDVCFKNQVRCPDGSCVYEQEYCMRSHCYPGVRCGDGSCYYGSEPNGCCLPGEHDCKKKECDHGRVGCGDGRCVDAWSQCDCEGKVKCKDGRCLRDGNDCEEDISWNDGWFRYIWVPFVVLIALGLGCGRAHWYRRRYGHQGRPNRNAHGVANPAMLSPTGATHQYSSNNSVPAPVTTTIMAPPDYSAAVAMPKPAETGTSAYPTQPGYPAAGQLPPYSLTLQGGAQPEINSPPPAYEEATKAV